MSQNKLESIVNETSVSSSPQVNVGDDPEFVYRFDNGVTDAVYVANSASNTVSVIDPVTSNVIKTIPVGESPTFISSVRTSPEVYVANFGSNTVSVIDPHTKKVTDTIRVGLGPSFIGTTVNGDASLFDPEERGDIAYVVNAGSDTVSVIDSTAKKVTDTIRVGDEPRSIAITNDYLYVTNFNTTIVSVINSTTNKVIKNITVGDGPDSIATSGDFVYVANWFNESISVINSTTNEVIKNITVGHTPASIATSGNFVYVANRFNVSVIDSAKNEVNKTLIVGKDPISLATYGNLIYVANTGTNTVSVINSTTNKVIKNITVGDGPKSIATSANKNSICFELCSSADAVYVANSHSNTVSVIDPAINKVMAGITFDTIPFRGGQIKCNDLIVPINRFFYVPSGTDCVAKSRSGYEFDSWVQIFDDNSTRTINASTPSDWLGYPLTSLREAFTDDPAATLTINRFGNFTAYFRALPAPVPAEFTASLITTIVAALAGSLLIPIALSWFKSKKQISILNSFHLDMVSINKDGLDEKDISKLNKLNQSVSNSYAAGKITNEQHTNLKNEISIAFSRDLQ
jgi:YVTN family beta-propeller protein